MRRLIYESYEVDFRFRLSHTYGWGELSQSKLTGMPRYNLANIVEQATDENQKTDEILKKIN